MKKFITFASILLLAGCSASTASAAQINTTTKATPVFAKTVETSVLRRAEIAKVISQVESRIGKTWYVFSGDTPRGWDCSGLTRWAYEQLGVVIPHSATQQAASGVKVKTPAVGDIVLFGYKNSKSYYHAALYVGKGMVVHAGFRRGMTTQLIPILSPAFKGSRITFIHVLTGS